MKTARQVCREGDNAVGGPAHWHTRAGAVGRLLVPAAGPTPAVLQAWSPADGLAYPTRVNGQPGAPLRPAGGWGLVTAPRDERWRDGWNVLEIEAAPGGDSALALAALTIGDR